MNYPAELQYTASHEWLRMEDGVAVIGISDFAQDALETFAAKIGF